MLRKADWCRQVCADLGRCWLIVGGRLAQRLRRIVACLPGHNNTFFNDLQHAEAGATVTITTHYGVYTYEVTGTEILDYQDETAYDFTRTDENLILYTCYPFDALGFTPNRFFVYAKYVSGPVLDANS